MWQISEHPVTAVASVLPDVTGAHPAITVELQAANSPRLQTGDRIDQVFSALLASGLHPVDPTGLTAPQADGWQVDIDDTPLGPSANVRICDPVGEALYDGQLVLPGAWLHLALRSGACLLLVGTGLRLTEGAGSAAEGQTQLRRTARAGRLVGAVAPVICRWSLN